jgi:acyl-CoA hydrolase
VASGNFATPWIVIDAIDRATPEWTLHLLNGQVGPPSRPGVTLETCFVGPGMRRQPTLAYVPGRLSLLPSLLGGPLAPDVVVAHTSTPSGGHVSLGTEVNIMPAAIESARSRGGLVVAVVNPRMPYTFGDGELSLDLFDLVVEIDTPLASPATSAPDDGARTIGDRVAARVPDAATLQAGIGSVPDSALAALVTRRKLRVWAEMISDGVLGLEQAGALDGDVAVKASFLFGSPELYTWAHRNPRLHMLRTETANDPGRIAANPRMTSINSALMVDLFDQANAAYLGGRVYSGFGGQSDFVAGALHSVGGQAMIALRSWHPKASCSTIVPLVDGPVTSFQHTAVITEHGTARMWGADQATQAREIIEHAADPRARDFLRESVSGSSTGKRPALV